MYCNSNECLRELLSTQLGTLGNGPRLGCAAEHLGNKHEVGRKAARSRTFFIREFVMVRDARERH
jgi:hypothetical protein